MTPGICPVCGAAVPERASACPECGADETTGWSEAARSQELDLPDEEFDYEAFVKREFGSKSPVPRGVHWLWWLIAIGIILLFLLGFLL